MILFHGTSTAHFDTIISQGLLPRSQTGLSNWQGDVESKPQLVYLTTAYPVYFAWQATHDPHDLLVLKVEVDDDELYPDEDFIAYIAQRRGMFPCHQLSEIIPQVEPVDNKHLAPHSLQHNGIVAVRSVPPEQILDTYIIPRKDWQTIMAIGGDSSPILNYLVLGPRYRRAMELLFEQGRAAFREVMREPCPISLDKPG